MAGSWLDTIKSALKIDTNNLGDSIVKANAVAKVVLTKEQQDKLKAKANAKLKLIEDTLVELIDMIPGVPRSVAVLAVTMLITFLKSQAATAMDKAKS